MKTPRPTAASALRYRIALRQRHAHLYEVTLTIPAPAARQEVSLPVWIPGSYLVREFARHLQQLQAQQKKRPLAVQQLDKCRWQIDCQAGQPLTLSYEVYAFDNSVRTAWLDSQRGFFNGTSLCLRVHGQEDQAHELQLDAPPDAPDWQAASALPAVKTDRRGFGLYRAADYDELVDSPFELGPFWQGEFTACGVPHRLVVAGAPASFDAERLLRDTRQICETTIRFWHPEVDPTRPQRSGVPLTRYVFMLNAVDDNYGGLEHRASTALICGRRDLPRQGEARAPEGYTTLLGLICHEYFHTWNVKRLRPAEFARYDYTQENYTRLLWFFEGFTSYYDDLLLRRAGLIDDAAYLRLLNKTLNQVLQAPGRAVQSVAEASFDAWVKYYRQDENTANATISYYTKGALVALCFDLSLRERGHSLDQALRAVWQRCSGGPMHEADFAAVLQALSGQDWGPQLAAWVHGRGELPLRTLLEQVGVGWHEDPAQPAQALGLRVTENGGAVQVKAVLRGGAVEAAGLAAGDEWLGVEVDGQGWRLGKLDELALYAGKSRQLHALVARDRRLLRLPLALPAQASTVRLSAAEATRLKPWLEGAPAPESAAKPVRKSAPASTQQPRKSGARLARKASTPSK